MAKCSILSSSSVVQAESHFDLLDAIIPSLPLRLSLRSASGCAFSKEFSSYSQICLSKISYSSKGNSPGFKPALTAKLVYQISCV